MYQGRPMKGMSKDASIAGEHSGTAAAILLCIVV